NPRDAGHRSASNAEAGEFARPLGPIVAHWLLLLMLGLLLVEVVLAWHFGHYSAVAGGFESPATGRALPVLSGTVAFLIAGCLAFVLIHNALTGDFFGFLPDGMRSRVEAALGVPPPAAGEGSHWRLEFLPYLWDAASDLWLAGFVALLGVGLIAWIYRH